jgi:hypothetical protein
MQIDFEEKKGKKRRKDDFRCKEGNVQLWAGK